MDWWQIFFALRDLGGWRSGGVRRFVVGCHDSDYVDYSVRWLDLWQHSAIFAVFTAILGNPSEQQ